MTDSYIVGLGHKGNSRPRNERSVKGSACDPSFLEDNLNLETNASNKAYKFFKIELYFP